MKKTSIAVSTCLLLVGTSSCAVKPLVTEHPLQGQNAASTMSPHEGRRMMEETLRDTTNLLGGRWDTQIDTYSQRCDAAGGSDDDDGVYYSGGAYRTDNVRSLNASAEIFASYWNSHGGVTWSASYVQDDKQVFVVNAFGNRTKLTLTAANTQVAGKGPCTPADWQTQDDIDFADLKETASPSPSP